MDFSAVSFSSQPRGLYNFISEIRDCKSKDDERVRVDKELANIRQKFSSSANLTSYDKKKYIWKLCYIYMLGYEIDFGHVEFISLLSSTKYQEKSVGYMAFSLMFRPGDQLMTLAVNSMRNDIVGQNNPGQALALAAVSNIGGNDLAEALSADVQRLITSPVEGSSNYHAGLTTEQEFRNKCQLCKKAALCLLRLFRTNPECVIVEEWMKRLARLLEDRDLGVITSIMSLLLGFASSNPPAFEPLVPYVVSILTRLVVNRTCSPDYLYYNIPSPWLQVKCLRFLQYFKIPGDPTQVELLQDALIKVLVKTDASMESYNKSNAENSVLFETISLIISYGQDAPGVLKDHAMNWLGRFISTKDPNIRYLGLDCMTRLAKLDGAHAVQQYQTEVFESLKDTDVSVRKRALNLVYVMTDGNNSKDVVDELTLNLPLSDPAMKEDIVVKVAILAEKYAHDFQWYVDTMIKIILLAGDYVAEAVLNRIVQIVINNQDIHEYAAEKMLQSVQNKFAHDNMVNVAGYLLGEIGVNVCERPGMTGYDQFAALHQHFANSSEKTRCVLLTAYAKFLNLYADQTQDVISDIFKKHSSSGELEIQQRSCEYIALSSLSSEVVEQVLNAMPPFPIEEKVNVLLSIEQNESTTADRSAWSVEQNEKNASRQAFQERINNVSAPSKSEEHPVKISKPEPMAKITKTVDLLSLDDDFSSATDFSSGTGSSNSLSSSEEQAMKAKLRDIYIKRGLHDHHLLVETAVLRVEVGADFRAHQGRIALLLTNKSHSDLTNLQATFDEEDAFGFKQQGLPCSIASRGNATLNIALDSLKPFTDSPVVNVHFTLQGSSHSYPIILPVSVFSYTEPLNMDKNTYMSRWKAITGDGTESQQVFPSGKPVDSAYLDYLRNTWFPGLKVGFADGLDSDKTFTGGATFLTGTVGGDGKRIAVGALLRLECDPNSGKLRITIRATHPKVSLAIKQFIVEQLS